MRNGWNKKLYVDTLKKLRWLGLVLLLITLLISFLYAFLGGHVGALRDVYETLPVLELYMFAGPLLLAFKGFAFLFDRSASDVFHAFPVSRRSMYVSILGAVLTWCIGTVILTVLFGYGCMMTFGWTFTPVHAVYQLLGYSLGCLLVTACTMIGISATGTRFTAFVVTGLVLFLPRFMLVIASVVLANATPLLSVPDLGILFRHSMNFPVSVVINMGTHVSGSLWVLLLGEQNPAVLRFLSPGTHVYTALLGVLYAVLGGVLFARRPSELAGNATSGPVLQHVYRCAITMPMLVAVCALKPANVNFENTGRALLWLLIPLALLVYFLYELITTRRVRNLLRAVYILPIPVLLALGITYGARAYGVAQQNILPEADEIAYITPTYHRSNNTYEGLLLQEAQMTDPALLRTVADELQRLVQLAQVSDGPVRVGNGYTLGITLENGRTLYRNLPRSVTDDLPLEKLMQHDPAYQEAWGQFPKDTEIINYARNIRYAEVGGNPAWTQAQLEEFLAAYREEYEALPWAEKRGIPGVVEAIPQEASTQAADGRSMLRWWQGVSMTGFMLDVEGSRNAWNFRSNYGVGAPTPRAANLAMRNTNAEYAEALTDAIGSIHARDIQYVVLRVSLHNIPYRGSAYHASDMRAEVRVQQPGDDRLAAASAEDAQDRTAEDMERALQWLLENGGEPDINAPYARYRIHIGRDNKQRQLIVAKGYVPLSQAMLADLPQLLECMGYVDERGVAAADALAG